MMRKHIPRSFFILVALLILFLSLPTNVTVLIRAQVVSVLTPVWQKIQGHHHDAPLLPHEMIQELELKNHLLSVHIDQLKEQLCFQEHQPPSQQLMAARVISRSPFSWENTVWVDAGEEDNRKSGKKIIVKNSPVLLGKNVIGIIEHVGKFESKVRLLTDPKLTSSVRVARGKEQSIRIANQMDSLLSEIYTHHEFFEEIDTIGSFVEHLDEVKQQLLHSTQESQLLAKGELQGSAYPTTRRKQHVLRGSGFNYDFADEAGPARDLRSGQPEGGWSSSAIPIIKTHDLLVTTGFDGVFPPGLHVAKVSKIFPLKEGDYFYEIEAELTAGDLEHLSLVFVIPPQSHI